MAINLSVRGESMPEGCFENLADCDVEACVATIGAGGESIWGIAVNVSEIACGQTDPRDVLILGLEAAARTGKPLLYGVRRPTLWPYDEQLAWLRPGDVITYCFRGGDWSIVDEHSRFIRPCAARERGVLFDVGHGTTAFDFKVAEAALADGFPPDTISSDLWRRTSIGNPTTIFRATLSKLIAIGMPEDEAFAAVTSRPARILGLDFGNWLAGSRHLCRSIGLTIQFRGPAAHGPQWRKKHSHGCWEPVDQSRWQVDSPCSEIGTAAQARGAELRTVRECVAKSSNRQTPITAVRFLLFGSSRYNPCNRAGKKRFLPEFQILVV